MQTMQSNKNPSQPTCNESKSATFSGYKKTEVKTALIDAIRNSRVENACYWSAEMLCSGLFLECWEILFLILGKYIHCANPLLVQYYRRRYELFRSVMNDPSSLTPVSEMHNHPTIRKLFAEMVSTVALSEKKPTYEEVRVSDEEVEDLVLLSTKLKADRADYITDVLKPEDPRDLHIGLNEFCYHLKQTHNMISACYWLEWLFVFAALKKKRGEPLFCACRTEYADVEKKYYKDMVWLIWETLLYVARSSYSLHTSTGPTLAALFELFRVRYSGTTTCKKRKYLFYFAITLVTEGAVFGSELVSEKNKEIIRVATENIDSIYEELLGGGLQRKKMVADGVARSYSEQEKKKNLQDSLQKLDLLSRMDTVLSKSV